MPMHETLYLKQATDEARRFVRRAEALSKKISDDNQLYLKGEQQYRNRFPVEAGATNRACMDLTRSLAQLRKTGGL